MKLVEALTSEEAIQGTINMWSDMQRDLGENPPFEHRREYKRRWLICHGYSHCWPDFECFLCERAKMIWMDVIGLKSRCDCCPIEWPESEINDDIDPKCVGHKVDYTKAPLSDILNYLKDDKNHAQWRIIT